MTSTPTPADWNGATRPPRPVRGEPGLLRGELPFIALLLGVVLVSCAVISPLFEFPLIDDWVYAMAVRHLVSSGQLQIPDWAAATIVAQVLWGALFAKVFGFSFSAIRLSTLTLSLAGSAALYGIARELGISQRRALVGAVVYWFNPLTFSLSYTFMSDVPALSLVLLATFSYLRGVRGARRRYLVIGSCLAALAFLVRQPALLVVPAVLGYGLLERQPWRAFARYSLLVAGVPALVTAVYLGWTQVHGTPSEEERVFETVFRHGFTVWHSGLLLAVYVLFYAGFFCLPLTLALLHSELACLSRLWSRGERLPLLAWGLVVPGLVALCYGYGALGYAPMRWMPYLEYGAMLHRSGIGPNDIVGRRATVLSAPLQVGLTVLAALSLFLLGVLLYGRLLEARWRPGRRLSPVWLPALVGLAQIAALFPVSVHVLAVGWVSFDRYLLPLVPFALLGVLWLSRGMSLSRTVLAAGLLAVASLSVAGTHDWLSYNQLRWRLGESLLARGVPYEKIDAGMEWDGWYLYKQSLGLKRARTPNGPFWTHDVAKATDSTYMVSFSPMPGYRVLERRPYRSWLHVEPVYLYLLQRQGP